MKLVRDPAGANEFIMIADYQRRQVTWAASRGRHPCKGQGLRLRSVGRYLSRSQGYPDEGQ